jgi:hypothetical protein
MSEVTGEVIGKYTRFRRSLPSGNSVSALNGELRTLRRVFRLAEEWALIPKAPVIHELPGKVSRERVVSFEEERRYLAESSPTVHDIAILAADTGLRPNSELFLVRWDNVHLDACVEGPHGFIHVPSGKTDAARRNVPLNPPSTRRAGNAQARYGWECIRFPRTRKDRPHYHRPTCP